jgi:hypothetical protein
MIAYTNAGLHSIPLDSDNSDYLVFNVADITRLLTGYLERTSSCHQRLLLNNIGSRSLHIIWTAKHYTHKLFC